MGQLENALEAYFFKQVRMVGGFAIKLAPTTRGLPDRLVILPQSRFALVELKTEDGSTSAIQRHFHEQLRLRTGVIVAVLYGRKDIDAWLRARVDEAGPQDRKPGRKPGSKNKPKRSASAR